MRNNVSSLGEQFTKVAISRGDHPFEVRAVFCMVENFDH